MMMKIKLYQLIIYIIMTCSLYANNYFFYNLNEGANLLSFPLIYDNNSINDFFNNNNPNLISNNDLETSIISIISEGEIGLNINNEWQGSLDEISTERGYWLILENPISFLYTGNELDDNTYFLHPGSNLISFSHSSEIHINDALPIYTADILSAIVGQNESLLIHNNQFYGSLTHFKPGNGYWFIANDYAIFNYDITPNRSEHEYNNIKNQTRGFNQSIVQSVFFTESIYLSGQKNNEELAINLYCNDQLVGNKIWDKQFSDLIAMGSDGYNWTEEYCELNQQVKIKDNLGQELYVIKGENKWIPNNYNIITLSDMMPGDINFDYNINIVDIVYMVEHVIDINNLTNDHQLLIADINQDETINIADILINIDTIISD